MNRTIIDWMDVKNGKPISSGWYMVVLLPKNHSEFANNPSEMNSWIRRFGINKIWYHNGEFWINHEISTDRVIYWSEIPSVPLLGE